MNKSFVRFFVIKRLLLFTIISGMVSILLACQIKEIDERDPVTDETTDDCEIDSEYKWTNDEFAVFEQQNYDKESLSEGNIQDRDEWYEGYDNDEVLTMHLTVSTGNETEGTNHTWKEVNTYSAYDYEAWGVDRYKVEGVLTVETEHDIVYCSDDGLPNVTVQVRGQTSSRSAQKNFKIRIKKGHGEYEEQRTIALNKHKNVPLRYNNKLAYDLLAEIPQVLSSRVRFVHLYVTDTTEGGTGVEEDYGLFTMVEQGNKTYLENHGIDDRGQLFKVTLFEWLNEAGLKQVIDGEGFNEAAFERLMEIKGDRDATLLNEVMEKINNYQIPIEEIVEKHFDSENLLYWLASQILIGNSDTGARNLFLYSPSNSEKFYIIPWDMDASFRRQYYQEHGYHEGLSWESGITQFVGVRLFERMFKESAYVDALTAAINNLYTGVISPNHVKELAERYCKIIEPYIQNDPDMGTRIADLDEVQRFSAGLSEEVRYNYKLYMESLKKPWPFHVEVPELDEEHIWFTWGVSYSPNNESITYDFVLSNNYDFINPIAEFHNLSVPIVETELLDPGRYYVRVVANDALGERMDCFEYLAINGLGKVYGCICFDLQEDGTVQRVERE